MESMHTYRVKVSSTAVRSGLAVAEGIQPSIAFTAPPDFQGPPGNWSPEHFLTAAVASCFVITFSAMAAASKFEFLSLSVEAQGIVEKDEAGWKFTKVVLRPRLKIVGAQDLDRGNRLLVKTEKHCLIGRSLACPLSMESEITPSAELVNS